MIGERVPNWLKDHIGFAKTSGTQKKRLAASSSAKTNMKSDDPMQGLLDLEARSVPLGIDAVPAYGVSFDPNPKLSTGQAAGGGLVADDRGNLHPHYHGHRERLRHRFLKGGHEPMPDYEIVELLLFNAVPRIDVKPLAKRLLAEFGDISGVVAASKHRLLKVSGATDKVYVQLRLTQAFSQRMAKAEALKREVLSSYETLVSYCQAVMAHRETEQFRVLFLDRKNGVIADEAQADGTVDHVPVYPREIAKRSLELNATAVILVHNHPSGDVTPSTEDLKMTEDIVRALGTIDVVVHEHLVVGKGSAFSFSREGFL